MFSAFANCWRIPELRARLVATVALVFVARIGANIPLPGIDPKDVDVSVSEDRLVISGEKKTAKEATGEGWMHRESHYGAFSRAIPLPEAVDPAKVTARYDKGVLTVELTKSPASASRKVPVLAS